MLFVRAPLQGSRRCDPTDRFRPCGARVMSAKGLLGSRSWDVGRMSRALENLFQTRCKDRQIVFAHHEGAAA